MSFTANGITPSCLTRKLDRLFVRASLEEVDADAAAAVTMRFYIGLSLEEIAESRGVSLSTICRDWVFARAFLLRQLSEAQ